MSGEITESSRYYDFLAWLEINKKQIVTGAVIVAVLAVAVSYYVYSKNQRELAANAALLKVGLPVGGPDQASPPTAQAYFKVADEYSSTKAGLRALLFGAGALFTDGKYSEALTEFQKFQNRYPGSSLCPIAALGVASCMDSMNQVDNAIKAYQDIITRYPDDAVAPQAKIALARLEEAKKQPEQALKLYEEVARQAGRSYWGSEANEARNVLLAKYPNLVRTNAPATPPAFSPSLLGTNAKPTAAVTGSNAIKTATNVIKGTNVARPSTNPATATAPKP
jgi:predicted negative regulator of RcsB-dependent stress response